MLGTANALPDPYPISSSFVKEFLDSRLVWVNKVAKENGVNSDYFDYSNTSRYMDTLKLFIPVIAGLLLGCTVIYLLFY